MDETGGALRRDGTDGTGCVDGGVPRTGPCGCPSRLPITRLAIPGTVAGSMYVQTVHRATACGFAKAANREIGAPRTFTPAESNAHPHADPGTRAVYTAALLLLLPLLVLAGCGRSAPSSYSPHENLLSIAAEFELLASRDPYREPVSRDLTGQAIHRATLLRLGAYEELHPGRLAPEVLVYKARALELLGDYGSALRHYEAAAEYDTELRDYANDRVRKLDRLLVSLAPPPATNDLMEMLVHLEEQGRELRELAGTFDEALYRSLAMREAEEAEVRRGEMMAANRFLLPDGERQALLAFEELVSNHRQSARAMEHALRLARYHRDLAEEEVRLNPPERLGFSADRFRRHYEEATDLLYRISQADGRPERLIARHELDAVLALGEEVARRAR